MAGFHKFSSPLILGAVTPLYHLFNAMARASPRGSGFFMRTISSNICADGKLLCLPKTIRRVGMVERQLDEFVASSQIYERATGICKGGRSCGKIKE